MSKKPAKKKEAETNKPAVRFTTEDLEQILKSDMRLNASPAVVKATVTKLLNQYQNADEEKKQELNEKYTEKTLQALAIYNLENHVLLVDTTTSEEHRTFAIEMATEIIKEYDCKTAVEKTLAHTITSAYIRAMEYSKLLSRVSNMEFISDTKIRYYGMLGKEIDRANRQYISGLSTLALMKAPRLAVTVKTKNAFVANNQQINASQDNKEGEIIDAE